MAGGACVQAGLAAILRHSVRRAAVLQAHHTEPTGHFQAAPFTALSCPDLQGFLALELHTCPFHPTNPTLPHPTTTKFHPPG